MTYRQGDRALNLLEEKKDIRGNNPSFLGESVDDYEKEARNRLTQSQIDYAFRGTESQSTLKRNVLAYSRLLLRRRVMQGIEEVDLRTSYFHGRIQSELPFFPGAINCSPIYPTAILDFIKVANDFSTPVFISHVAVVPPVELSKLPSLVSNKQSSLIWQIYMRTENVDECYKQAALAESWGYKGLTITVDTELNVKLGNEIPPETRIHPFIKVTPKEVRRLKESSSLPLMVKGVMTHEDAELAIESGADGVIVSNHGGRTMDHGQATIEVLPDIVKRLKSKKKTRDSEVFIDGGIRRGSDILIALALGAKGCLIGRPMLWALAVDNQKGASNVMGILKSELERASILCGVSKISRMSPSMVRKAEF